MRYVVTVYLDMEISTEVEVEADDIEQAIDLAYELVQDRIKIDKFYIAGIRDENFDPADIEDDYAYAVDREAAKRCFDFILPFWPDRIDVTGKELLPGGGAHVPNLIDVGDDVDLHLEQRESEWPSGTEEFLGEVAYCMYGVILGKAREAVQFIEPRRMTFEELEQHFLQKHIGWAPNC